MKVDHIFPIPVARFTVDKEIVDNTRQLIYKYIEDTDFLSPAAPGQLLTTFYKDKTKNFLGILNDQPLLHYINTTCREYIKLLGYDERCYIEVTSWLQFNQPGSYFVRHDHYGALVSAVLYIDVPENSGDILFHNPLETRRMTETFFTKVKTEENEYNFNHVTYKPVVGEILMFEPWLHHTVQENRSDKNRISIGFNIWAGQDVKN
jgi:uncharacterized protein (TIGR02466 family)